MKNLIIICFLLISSNIYAITLETMNRAISNSTGSQQQTFRCNKIILFDKKNGNPDVCLKATKMSGIDKRNLGENYYNAGILYTFGEKYKDHKKAFKMYKLSYDAGYGKYSSSVMTKIGYFYWQGWGIETNKILAYKYFLEGAKAGNQNAQGNLDILCKESPWACK